jgi:lipopolysaccharide transport system ATP-binding protein
MNPLAIKVQHVNKKYTIVSGPQASYGLLRDQITKVISSPVRMIQSLFGNNHHTNQKGKQETLWALQDINFEIRTGEVVGLIGPNGAGKSTLLKILTRITEPTNGIIDIYGRVGSLLEVGTGFHKELTGKENVYLNGAILGMKKAEIDKKFDEIVAFAEVEKFINTPVKFFSSGMSVRLAFAVAAHLVTEILLVDEVLAVGDASFQKKCLNKMEDVGKLGRTVIFVSHHMPSITRLCERAILLQEGKVIHDGPAHQIVGEYLSAHIGAASQREWKNFNIAPGNQIVRLIKARVKTAQNDTVYTHDIRHEVGIEMMYKVIEGGHTLYPLIGVHNEEGLWIFTSIDHDPEWLRKPRPPGVYLSTVWIPGNFLSEGTMTVDVSIRTESPHQVHFYERDVIAFQIVESPDGDAARMDYPGRFPGVVRPLLNWDTLYNRK